MSFGDCLTYMPLHGHKPKMPNEKMFVLKGFLDITKELDCDGASYQVDGEEFFDRMWSIGLVRDEDKLNVLLRCCRQEGAVTQAVELDFTVTIQSFTFNRPEVKFHAKFRGDEDGEEYGGVVLDWKYLEMVGDERFRYHTRPIVPDTVLKRMKLYHAIGKEQSKDLFPHVVKLEARIRKTQFLVPSPYLQRNSGPNALNVGGKVFYVDKQELAKKSYWLKKVFIEGDSDRAHILQTEIDAYDFHHFLQVLLNGTELTDDNFEGILVVAAICRVKRIMMKCLEFLSGKRTRMTLEKKFQLALQYGWDDFRNTCILKFNSYYYFDESIPSYLQDLEPSALQAQWDCVLIEYLREKAEGLWPDTDDEEEPEEEEDDASSDKEQGPGPSQDLRFPRLLDGSEDEKDEKPVKKERKRKRSEPKKVKPKKAEPKKAEPEEAESGEEPEPARPRIRGLLDDSDSEEEDQKENEPSPKELKD